MYLGPVAQLVERLAGSEEARSSNLLRSTNERSECRGQEEIRTKKGVGETGFPVVEATKCWNRKVPKRIPLKAGEQ